MKMSIDRERVNLTLTSPPEGHEKTRIIVNIIREWRSGCTIS
jgi:hypothetical protein